MRVLTLLCLSSAMMLAGCSTTDLNNASKMLGNEINTFLSLKPTKGSTSYERFVYAMEHDARGNRVTPDQQGWQKMLDSDQVDSTFERNIFSTKRSAKKGLVTFESRNIYKNSAAGRRELSIFTSQIDNYKPSGKEYIQTTNIVDCRNNTYKITNARLYSPTGKLLMRCPPGSVGDMSKYSTYFVNYFCN